MKQLLDLYQRILDEGVWVTNERTGKRCLTVINADLEYDLSDGTVPVVTTKKLHWKPAIAEILGYMLGYTNAEKFRDLGCKTWDANANENQAWLNNPHRKGEDAMGFVYGAVARNFPKHDGTTIDLIRKVYDDLRKGIDDRGEIITFWNPGYFEKGCLRPCMYEHQFSILGDTLYLNSTQRSWDGPLGGPFNSLQVAWLLRIMAQITGLKPGKAFHKIINAHTYEDQVELLKEQLSREPLPAPKLDINPNIKTLEDLETWVTVGDFELVGYEHHPAITFPFSV